ncbi:sensory neuron membrane protein 2 [Plodia interpunctella]|uniref:sensory neuron membrane protein 2 n=1 Tax=Plodia interpunctella TaxID=58824 RepID=UPI00236757B3|nr:sensory neuron membrane protein 2-like [Plodia interpunctella]
MLGKHSKLCFGVSLAALIISVVLAAWGFPKIVSKQIQKSVQIENSSLMFDKWRVLPMPLQFKIHLFNVTNVEEINQGRRPRLVEVGPYVYKEYREKIILGYGENDTIKYMLKKTFYFDPEASGSLREDDELTVINFSYMAAMLTVNDMMPSLIPTLNKGFEELFSGLTDAFMTVKVRDLLFDGIFLNCVGNQTALGLICAQIKSDLPPTMRVAEEEHGIYFSMFSHLNRTASGPYDMVRGTEDIKELGHIVAFKDKTRMSAWGNDPYCGRLNGSDGSIFPPIDEKNVPQRLYTFQPDICRSIYISLVEKTSIFNMPAYYYEFSESTLAAKSANPNNRCFCKKNWSANHDGCLIMGLLNLMPCQKAPAIISLPHFYLASEELLEYFGSGINPDKEKHNTFIYLEPVTGVVLKGVQRLQFNVELRQMNVPQLEKVRTGLFPLLWIEESAEIPENIQSELRQSHKLLGSVEVARWALVALALAALAFSAVLVARTGALPICPRNNNAVSFVLRPAPGIDANKG